MYKLITKQELFESIESSWFPTWFAVENTYFLIDMCCNYRLNDGKICFVKVKINSPEEGTELIKLLSIKTKQLWIDEVERLEQNAHINIKEYQNTKIRLSKIIFNVNHIYALGCENSKLENCNLYKCAYIEKEAYLVQLLEKEYYHLPFFYKEPCAVSQIVDSTSTIIDLGYQPHRKHI